MTTTRSSQKHSKAKKDDVSKAQDLHTMLDAILDSSRQCVKQVVGMFKRIRP